MTAIKGRYGTVTISDAMGELTISGEALDFTISPLESPPDAWIASKGEIVQNQGWHDTTDRKTRRGCDRAIFRSKPNWRIGAVWWWRTGEIVAYRVKTVSGQHRRGYFSDGSARWTHDRIRHEISILLDSLTTPAKQ